MLELKIQKTTGEVEVGCTCGLRMGFGWCTGIVSVTVIKQWPKVTLGGKRLCGLWVTIHCQGWPRQESGERKWSQRPWGNDAYWLDLFGLCSARFSKDGITYSWLNSLLHQLTIKKRHCQSWAQVNLVETVPPIKFPLPGISSCTEASNTHELYMCFRKHGGEGPEKWPSHEGASWASVRT